MRLDHFLALLRIELTLNVSACYLRAGKNEGLTKNVWTLKMGHD